MKKDLTRKEIEELYLPPTDEFVMLHVPELPFFMLDGRGSPDDEPFQQGIQWLFTSIHPIKLEAKRRLGRQFLEPPLEALFWAEDMADLAAGRKERLEWRLMIPAPMWATESMLADGIAAAEKRRGAAPSGLRLDSLHEGECVQVMHVGTPEGERETLARLYGEFLPENDLAARGPYHEIYLNDARRTAPSKRKTVLRQPVCPR